VLIAITREVSSAIERCELTHLARTRIDVPLARRQHDAYERCLEAAGCTVKRLPAGDDMPDSVFVEDIAVVFDELAIVTRPGAVSRRTEIAGVAEALSGFRSVLTVEAPGTVDGGDVLIVGKRVFVGRSSRTNGEGIDQMRRILEPCGYQISTVEVDGCLHLKSAVTAVGDNRLLINPAWVRATDFAGFALIAVDPTEPFAANALRLGDRTVYSDAFPLTRRRLQHCVRDIVTVDLSETAKAEGGVTCCSLIVRSP
jgi:dimethylargininase